MACLPVISVEQKPASMIGSARAVGSPRMRQLSLLPTRQKSPRLPPRNPVLSKFGDCSVGDGGPSEPLPRWVPWQSSVSTSACGVRPATSPPTLLSPTRTTRSYSVSGWPSPSMTGMRTPISTGSLTDDTTNGLPWWWGPNSLPLMSHLVRSGAALVGLTADQLIRSWAQDRKEKLGLL